MIATLCQIGLSGKYWKAFASLPLSNWLCLNAFVSLLLPQCRYLNAFPSLLSLMPLSHCLCLIALFNAFASMPLPWCLCLDAFAVMPLPWCLCLDAFALMPLPQWTIMFVNLQLWSQSYYVFVSHRKISKMSWKRGHFVYFGGSAMGAHLFQYFLHWEHGKSLMIQIKPTY